jgi:hypothetical protein
MAAQQLQLQVASLQLAQLLQAAAAASAAVPAAQLLLQLLRCCS